MIRARDMALWCFLACAAIIGVCWRVQYERGISRAVEHAKACTCGAR